MPRWPRRWPPSAAQTADGPRRSSPGFRKRRSIPSISPLQKRDPDRRFHSEGGLILSLQIPIYPSLEKLFSYTKETNILNLDTRTPMKHSPKQDCSAHVLRKPTKWIFCAIFFKRLIFNLINQKWRSRSER